MLPVEFAPLTLPVVRGSTVWSAPALATSGSGGSGVPWLASTGTLREPPLADLTVIASGGAAHVMSPAPVESSVLLNAGTLSCGAEADLSLVRPWTWRVLVLES